MSGDKHRTASQAANTNSMIGIMLARVMWVLKTIHEAMTKIDNIMPSRHRRDDIR